MAKIGVARTFQNIRLFKEMTALENVMVGRHPRTGAGLWGAVTCDKRTRPRNGRSTMPRRPLLEFVELGGASDMLAKNLPYATSGGWRSPGPWPRSPSCCAWTSRRPA